MKVTIVKYLNKKGFIKEINKESLNGKVLPENIIEEYEVEIPDVVDLIEDTWLEDLKRKYESGNYTLIYRGKGTFIPTKWKISLDFDSQQYYNFKLIHNKHKDILEAYLKNSSVEIECTNYISKDVDMETIWYIEEDFIENYDEDYFYRLKVKDLAWYEDENMVGKMIYDGLNMEYGLVLNIKDNLIETSLDRKYSLNEINSYKLRPATESEVLSLVYKPQQKISKEINLVESNRLKDLFLNNEAECLVENEQEFKLVYDFLDKTCDKNLRRWIPSSKDSKGFYDRFPLLILCNNEWNNIFEYNLLKDRKVSKPLIKYSNGVFILVKQGGEI